MTENPKYHPMYWLQATQPHDFSSACLDTDAFAINDSLSISTAEKLLVFITHVSSSIIAPRGDAEPSGILHVVK